MPITLGSNIAALRSQRQLQSSSRTLGSIFERLASGRRINRAADDAAGLAISSSLNVDGRVFNQGIRNLNEGLSYLNVTEGAIHELKNILIRQRELASQSSNGVYSDTQRSSMNGELEALVQEYNRIIDSTEYNGRSVFTGDEDALVLQAGYGVDATLRVLTRSTTLQGGSGASTFSQTLGSVSTDGTQGNQSASSPVISGDGRYLAFHSGATNLVAGDSNGWDDVFWHDSQTGVTTRVSVASDGTQGVGGASEMCSISADGRYVAFESWASNLVSGDSNGARDIFVHDTQTNSTTRVSVDSDGTEGDNASSRPAISADGRYVAFESWSTNLVAGDTNGVPDLFVHDRQTGTTTRVSVDSDGTQGNDQSITAAISPDGRYVAFNSPATNLVAGDTNGAWDVFVHDTQTGATTTVSVDSDGTQGDDVSSNPSISSDGRYVAFQSVATNLVAGDSNGQKDVFLHDRQTGITTLVSVDPDGTQGNNESNVGRVSADGRYVAFQSIASNLVAGDTNAARDIFVTDSQTGILTRLSVDSDGTEADGLSNSPAISADGTYVAFHSAATNLVAGDTNGHYDIFRAPNLAAASSAPTAQSSPLLDYLSGLSVSSQSSALQAQGTIDSYLSDLHTQTGEIGAAMSRIQVAIGNLQSQTENVKAAESRIVDADVAKESSRLVRRQILQQAASSVLAQANQQPALALSLLG